METISGTIFRDRRDAGQRLAGRLSAYRNDPSVIVLGLPRGGVPVAFEIAAALRAPLDVFMVRKLGVPGHRELAMGAIASGGVRILNEDVIRQLEISPVVIEAAARQEQHEMERQERAYRGQAPARDFAGRTVIVVDDGLATGSTMRAAVAALRRRQAARIVAAVPVASDSAVEALRPEVDQFACLNQPESFRAVSVWYEEFLPTSDEEVERLLEMADRERLSIPASPRGAVVFAHGSGSTHRSPRNRFVAARLNQSGFATLLIDLLAEEEPRFDIALLAGRLSRILGWLAQHPEIRGLPLGLYGASTGAAAALVAASDRTAAVRAVVSRGGRPDLAGDALERVQAPVLLIVGGADPAVLELNRGAMARLRCEKELAVVPGAGHLFEEPGALEQVAQLTRAWFDRWLCRA